MKDDQDIFLVITNMIPGCTPIRIQFFIMGQQDKKSNCPLMVTEQLNMEYDQKANQYVITATRISTSFGNPAILAAQPDLWIGSKLICCKLFPPLQQAMSNPAYNDYLIWKLNWTHSNINQVHWSVLLNVT